MTMAMSMLHVHVLAAWLSPCCMSMCTQNNDKGTYTDTVMVMDTDTDMDTDMDMDMERTWTQTGHRQRHGRMEANIFFEKDSSELKLIFCFLYSLCF
jgi:hypothetical protein